DGIRDFHVTGVQTCALPIFPLLSHDRVLGALDLGRSNEDQFSTPEIDLLGEVAKQIAIAVENAQAYRQITELKDRLAKEKLYLRSEERRVGKEWRQLKGPDR